MDEDIKDRFDELSVHLGRVADSVMETRHGLKASIEQMMLSLAQNSWELHHHKKEISRLTDVDTDHERRLRVLETIAAKNDDVTYRDEITYLKGKVIDLEKSALSAGRFTWKDIFQALAGMTALMAIIGVLIKIALVVLL